jgi:hypothetical protein
MANLSDSQIRALLEDVKDELGLEAYHIYPDSKRWIPDQVLWAIAGACIVEFCFKGLIDLKALGEKTRQAALALVEAWHERTTFEARIQTLDINGIVREVGTAVPSRVVTSGNLDASEKELADSLRAFGLTETAAALHAAAIRKIVAAQIAHGA